MAAVRQVSGGGRAVDVSPERLAGWFDRFDKRNDGVRDTRVGPEEVLVRAGNGTTATATVPFPPLEAHGLHEGLAVQDLIAHARRARRIGVVLVRLGGYSMGVAEDGHVTRSRTDRRQVQGRSSAGGWSQKRFARRREGQARQALQAAARDVLEVLGPELSGLDAVVLGGDRTAIDRLRAEPHLEPVFALALPRVLDVAEPRRRVLDEAAERARAVEIVIRDPESG